MADVLIASATSWDGDVLRNIGDEALTDGLAQAFVRRGHRVLAALNGADGVAPGRVCLSRPAALVQAVRGADLVVLGGGTLLAGHVDGASLLPQGHPRYLAVVTAVAAAYRKPVALVGVGAERWPSGIEDRLLRGVIGRAASVWVRDPASAALVEARCGRTARISGDAFFGARLAPAVPLTQRGGHVVVALSGRTTQAECAAVAERLSQVPDADVRIRCMDQHGDDAGVARDLARRLEAAGMSPRLSPYVTDWRAAYAEMATARAVVASRLHALLFAGRAHTPSLAVGRSTKVLSYVAAAEVPLLGTGRPPRVVSSAYLHAQASCLEESVDRVLVECLS